MMNCFHLVSLSPWPILSSFNLLFLMTGMIMFMYMNNLNLLLMSLILLLINLMQWWRDTSRESLLQGMHTHKVETHLRMGMIFFIISEIMFFLSFFWTYFHFLLSPTFEIGFNFPSFFIKPMNPYTLPLMNTLILLCSGITITLSHHSILNNKFKLSKKMNLLTFMLGMIFLLCQMIEYYYSNFSFNSSCYGSIFFLTTGFHGFHVFIGSIFILIIYLLMKMKKFSSFHHFGFEASAWYWHFVDVIWLFLYTFMYYLIF